VPLIRFHSALFPTIQFLLTKKKIKVTVESFKDTVLEPYLDKLGAAWIAGRHRECTITQKTMTFVTTDKALKDKAPELFDKLDKSLRAFFERWGFTFAIEVSSLRGKFKMHVSYRYNSDKQPVIPLIEEVAAIAPVTINLGNVRLQLSLGKTEMEVKVSQAAGSGWAPLVTSQCKYSQISDIRPMLNALLQIPSKAIDNFDITAD
jgi:hypothetical protein